MLCVLNKPAEFHKTITSLFADQFIVRLSFRREFSSNHDIERSSDHILGLSKLLFRLGI